MEPDRPLATDCALVSQVSFSVHCYWAATPANFRTEKKKALWNNVVPDESKSHFGKFKFPSAIGREARECSLDKYFQILSELVSN